MESLKQESLYQQMNLVLKEREEIYQKREQELKKHREELAVERAELDRRQEELEKYKESIAQELEHILREKLELQVLINERLKLESEQDFFVQTKSRNMLEMPDTEKPESLPEEIQTEAEEDGQTAIQKFAQEALKVFPEGEMLEITEDTFCMSVGDKELRIFMQVPPVATIIAKREKDKYLLKGISQINRMQSDWEFSYQGNCLKCGMPFTESMPAAAVLQKCTEAMDRYFK